MFFFLRDSFFLVEDDTEEGVVSATDWNCVDGLREEEEEEEEEDIEVENDGNGETDNGNVGEVDNGNTGGVDDDTGVDVSVVVDIGLRVEDEGNDVCESKDRFVKREKADSGVPSDGDDDIIIGCFLRGGNGGGAMVNYWSRNGGNTRWWRWRNKFLRK